MLGLRWAIVALSLILFWTCSDWGDGLLPSIWYFSGHAGTQVSYCCPQSDFLDMLGLRWAIAALSLIFYWTWWDSGERLLSSIWSFSGHAGTLVGDCCPQSDIFLDVPGLRWAIVVLLGNLLIYHSIITWVHYVFFCFLSADTLVNLFWCWSCDMRLVYLSPHRPKRYVSITFVIPLPPCALMSCFEIFQSVPWCSPLKIINKNNSEISQAGVRTYIDHTMKGDTCPTVIPLICTCVKQVLIGWCLAQCVVYNWYYFYLWLDLSKKR